MTIQVSSSRVRRAIGVLLIPLIITGLCAACSSTQIGSSPQNSYQVGEREGAKLAHTDLGAGLSNQDQYDCNPKDPLQGRTIPAGINITQWEKGCIAGYDDAFG